MNRHQITLLVVVLMGALGFAEAQQPSAEWKLKRAEQTRFLQQHFTNFAPVNFLAPEKESQTAIQSFRVQDRVVGMLNGLTYVGVRFTVPDWLDGNLKWSYFHLNPASRKGGRVDLSWGIIPERGEEFGHSVERIDPGRKNDFWRTYPNTRRAYTHTIDRTNLQAGASYALYFVHYEKSPPDVAFGLTVDSERGRQEFGSMSFISGRAGIPGAVEEANLLTFIRENWTNFPVMKMLPPTNKSDAVLQLFKPNDHIAGWFAGQYYCGLRFTVPEWLDGDLEVAFVHRYRSTKELNTRPGYGWGITAEREYFFGMGPVKRIPFKDLPEMRARYPFTEKAYAGRVDQRALVPGKTYVYWWAFSWSREEGVMPDMDVALTIVSPRGRKDYGEILWR